MPTRAPQQRSFDDLGTPLIDVAFCVLDLETTGGAAVDDAITEVGAIVVQGGECLRTFHTLVNPGRPIPPQITVLTGITEAMVMPAPRIDEVLPSLLEFVRGTVIVGHNIRFDLSFLNTALRERGRPPLSNRSIDTLAMARRLVREEVPNLRLGTLADRFRLDHRPAHRALDDALATADLLHVLLERAGSLGVTGLDDLLALPTMSGHAQAGKLKLTTRLPRSPGVYLFKDRHGSVLYVGKATNLRARVRSYFSSDDRRKIGQLLRETAAIEHHVCANTLEAAVLEVRLIHAHRPRHNRQAKNWGRYRYVKLTLGEAFPRLSIVRALRRDGALYLGPLPSAGAAQLAIDAVHTAVPLRRCTERLSGRAGRAPLRDGACSAAQLGVSVCPCSGAIDAAAYAEIVDRAVRGLTREPELLFAPLRARMDALAHAERFEEAAATRDRAAALANALRRQRRVDQLRRAESLVLGLPDETAVEIRSGRLAATAGAPAPEPPADAAPMLPLVADRNPVLHPWRPVADLEPDEVAPDLPLPTEQVDEVLVIAGWLDRNHQRLRLVSCDGQFSSAVPALPTFQPTPVRSSRAL